MFRRIIDALKRFSAGISSGMAEVFEEEMQGRADMRLVMRHACLCADLQTAENLWRRGFSSWGRRLKGRELQDHLAKYRAAVMDLREFLGRLSDGEARSIARIIGQDYAYDDPKTVEERVYAFLLLEREAADDASEREICSHADRFNRTAYGERAQPLLASGGETGYDGLGND
jgi:hypothetical protein